MPSNKMLTFEGKLVDTFDVTPTWESLLPVMLLVLENNFRNAYPNREQRENTETLKSEFRKMAKAADNWIEFQKQGEDETNDENQF